MEGFLDEVSGMRKRYRKLCFSFQQQLPVCQTLNAPFSTLKMQSMKNRIALKMGFCKPSLNIQAYRGYPLFDMMLHGKTFYFAINRTRMTPSIARI